MLRDFPETPAIGFSILIEDGDMRATLAVPAATLKAIGDYMN